MAQERGPDSRPAYNSALVPHQAWSVPSGHAIFSSNAWLFPKVQGGHPCLTPSHKERTESGTWLSIYCSANRECWGPARPLPSSRSSPSSLQASFPEHSRVLICPLSVTQQVPVSRGFSLSPVSLVPSGADSAQLSNPSCPPSLLPSLRELRTPRHPGLWLPPPTAPTSGQTTKQPWPAALLHGPSQGAASPRQTQRSLSPVHLSLSELPETWI